METLDARSVAKAAALFIEARRTGVPLPAMPDDCSPRSTADVNAIVDRVTETLTRPVADGGDGEAIVGWKIGFVYSPRQAPMICPLFGTRVFDSPARVPLTLTPALRIEPEISFKLMHGLPARSKPYRAAEVAEALVACPSLEIIDTRFDTRSRSIRQMIDDKATRLQAMADHNTTGAYVVALGRADWQDFDFAAMRVVMSTPDRVLVETTGGHAFTDPFLPCVVLANQMRSRGGLAAGQLMVTGSFSGFFEVAADEQVMVEFVGFGSAHATICTDP